jgi:DNA polymerase
MDWLRAQIELIRPKIIVCVGRISAMAMIKKDFKISKEHGSWFERDGVLYFALYHPAALLRDQNLRPDTFSDLKELQRTIKAICAHTL